MTLVARVHGTGDLDASQIQMPRKSADLAKKKRTMPISPLQENIRVPDGEVKGLESGSRADGNDVTPIYGPAFFVTLKIT